MSEKPAVDRRAFVAAMTAAGAGVLAAAGTSATAAEAAAAQEAGPRAATAQLRLLMRVSLVGSGGKLEPVAGASTVAGFVGWIPARSYDLSFERAALDGNVLPTPPLSVVAPMGPHSAPLFSALLLNRTVGKVQLVGLYSATSTWRLLDLTVTELSFTGGAQTGAAGGGAPMETWRFDYTNLVATLRPDNGSGQPGTAVVVERDWTPMV